VSVALGSRPEGERFAGRRQPVERGDSVLTGRRGKDPARKIDVTSPALLVEQPGRKVDGRLGLAAAIDRLDVDFPDAVQGQFDRCGDSRCCVPTLGSALFVNLAEFRVVESAA
jgi:hypothetical protein